MEVLMEVGGQGEALGMGRGTEIGLWTRKTKEGIWPFSLRLIPTGDMLPTREVGAFS